MTQQKSPSSTSTLKLVILMCLECIGKQINNLTILHAWITYDTFSLTQQTFHKTSISLVLECLEPLGCFQIRYCTEATPAKKWLVLRALSRTWWFLSTRRSYMSSLKAWSLECSTCVREKIWPELSLKAAISKECCIHINLIFPLISVMFLQFMQLVWTRHCIKCSNAVSLVYQKH